MLEKKITQVRELLLSEIVATVEYLAYLKNEVEAPVRLLILKQESRKIALVTKLKALELIAY